jgi:hypothetical protein
MSGMLVGQPAHVTPSKLCRLLGMRELLRVAIAGAVLLADCGDDKAASSGADASAEMDAATPVKDSAMPQMDASTRVSYANDVRPIFQRCVICHRANSIIDLDLTNPFDVMHGIINRSNSWAEVHESSFDVVVKPGDPDHSFLIYKVEADPNPEQFDVANNGDPMPMHIPRVSAAELADIKTWIADGAKNDAFFSANVASIFGTEITLGGKSGKCTFCHYPGSSTGLDILAVFDATKGLVGAKSLLSTKLRVAPGSPDQSFLVEKVEQANPSAGAQMPLHYERLSAAEVAILRRWIAQGATSD